MDKVSPDDYAAMLDAVETAMDEVTDVPGSPWLGVCAELVRATHAHVAAVFEVDWPECRVLGAAWPSWARGLRIDGRHARTHPLVVHFRDHRDDQSPHALDEVADPYGWRSGSAFAAAREACRRAGATFQLAMPLSSSAWLTRGVGLGRSRPGFGSADRRYLRWVRPILLDLDHRLYLRDRRLGTPGRDAPNVDPRRHGPALTPRQLAVLRLLSAGLTADAIAHNLGISKGTATKHLDHLYRRLGVHDRLSAVTYGRAYGLLARLPDTRVRLPDARVRLPDTRGRRIPCAG